MAPVKDYLFCWQVNKRLRIDFRQNNDIEIQLTRRQRSYFFTVYEYAQPNDSLAHYLYNNQFDGEYLLPEFRHLDFLWLMKGDWVEDAVVSEAMQAIRSISGVQLVMELTNEKIRNKQHLIF